MPCKATVAACVPPDRNFTGLITMIPRGVIQHKRDVTLETISLHLTHDRGRH
jgi:hypothetical protein